ncbi:MAG: hypothetical protein J6V87_07735 [Prevotella sp.]|nr:hypothetical protein [Prevotella sp.]
MQTSRGLRNCNPLNIIKTKNTVWLGQIHTGAEKTFCQFSEMVYGCRAALKLLRTYYTKYDCTTLRRIISRWAPETENNVLAYVRNVSRMTGIGATTPLPPMKAETRELWVKIVLAMATVECGLDQKGQEELLPIIEDAWWMLFKS